MGPFKQGKDQYPESVKKINVFLRSIAPNMRKTDNRLIVTLPGSWVSYIGTSARNVAHARWIVSHAIKAIKDESLTSLDGGPIDVLIMPYYRA
jgi:hypothetical protein